MTDGPFDVADVDLADGVARVDLGALLIPMTTGVDVQVQVDEQSGTVVQATRLRFGAQKARHGELFVELGIH